MKGRKPTPTKILKLRGSWLAKTRPNEPQPEVAGRAPPADLAERFHPHWFAYVDALPTGVLTKADIQALRRMAIRRERFERAIESEEPDDVLLCKLSLELLRYEQDFGMTPSSRARVKVSDKPDAGKLDKYRSKRA